MSADVVIYTTQTCPFCIRAKSLLNSKGVKYKEISVDNKPALREEMTKKAGSRTVPQIWIGSHHVGGCTDLMALDASGKLNAMLKIS